MIYVFDETDKIVIVRSSMNTVKVANKTLEQ
jgi:hypothetical protein